jgi:hypothetical protein
MLDTNIWQPINNKTTGYVGLRRNEEWAKRDALYGKGNWEMGWLVDDKYLQYPEVCQLYGDAYYHYFQMRPELLDYLVEVASDVYDYDPSDIEAGTDYAKRGDIRTHIQDTAIRRCVQRLGKKFKGNRLLQIKDRERNHPLSSALSPGQVPFHKPELLSFPDNLEEMRENAWWLPGSVEDFYQRAKRLCVKKEALKATDGIQ